MFTHNPLPPSTPPQRRRPRALGPAGPERISGARVGSLLAGACRAHEPLSLTTPSLKADAIFLALTGDGLWVATTLCPESQACLVCEGEANPVELQFLTENKIFIAQSRLLRWAGEPPGNGLRLELPEVLCGYDARQEPRRPVPGTPPVWFDLAGSRVFAGEVLNASEHGLAILAGSHAALATLPLDHPITLAIFLDGLGTLENVGRLRHREGKVLGLTLDSPLEAEFLAALGGICENR